MTEVEQLKESNLKLTLALRKELGLRYKLPDDVVAIVSPADAETMEEQCRTLAEKLGVVLQQPSSQDTATHYLTRRYARPGSERGKE